jgi:hypothetical protein
MYEFDEFDEDDEFDEGDAPRLSHRVRRELELGDLLVTTLQDMAVPTAKRKLYLEAGAALAADAVSRIVGNKDRRRYSQAVAHAVAHAEAIAITQGEPDGDAAVEAAQSRYPRHTAYRTELRVNVDAFAVPHLAGTLAVIGRRIHGEVST